MDETYETKKIGGDKIALLGLFIVAVLTAHFIVVSRSAIVLSEPIKLSCADLSVSMPVENGWQSEKQWNYQKNAFTLSSFFVPGSGNPTALAYCQYLLAATKATPDMRFKQKASAVGGAIEKTGKTHTGALAFDWAHIKKQKTPVDLFFGTAQLPNNRQLNIEVHETTGETDLAQQVFKRITESLKFKHNLPLEAGSEIIAKIKSKGLDSFLDNQSREAFFLIKDAGEHTIGFTMDVLIDSGRDDQLNIQATSLLYIRGRYAQEQATFLQSDNSFDEFTWKSETSTPADRSGSEIALDKAGIITVRKFGPQPEKKIYQLSPAAIPDVFLEFIFSQILDSNHKKIIVDIIEANGTITPAFVSRIEAEDTAAAKEEAAYVFRLELLNGWGFSEQVYLDDQKQISKRLLQQKNIYILECTSLKNIARQFPERADYILRKNKMLEQNQSQY